MFFICSGKRQFYVAVSAAIKEFRRDDFNLFIDTINPKKMLAYMKEEIRRKRRRNCQELL
ncbi:MAG TPA: hypothetical protein ENI51_05675 [Candidatus Atribacteria bacterium]|nr:hypothetical protein [Candidatus Atribacteria bacterium]